MTEVEKLIVETVRGVADEVMGPRRVSHPTFVSDVRLQGPQIERLQKLLDVLAAQPLAVRLAAIEQMMVSMLLYAEMERR